MFIPFRSSPVLALKPEIWETCSSTGHLVTRILARNGLERAEHETNPGPRPQSTLRSYRKPSRDGGAWTNKDGPGTKKRKKNSTKRKEGKIGCKTSGIWKTPASSNLANGGSRQRREAEKGSCMPRIGCTEVIFAERKGPQRPWDDKHPIIQGLG